MSIPTSLIFVFLVAAWLAVLVPMVARRREAVPEAETDGGTFRVLRRGSRAARRRPVRGRGDHVEDDISERMDSGGTRAYSGTSSGKGYDPAAEVDGARYDDDLGDQYETDHDADEYDSDQYDTDEYDTDEHDVDQDRVDRDDDEHDGAEPEEYEAAGVPAESRGRFRRWGRRSRAEPADDRPQKMARTGAHPYRPANRNRVEQPDPVDSGMPSARPVDGRGSSPYSPPPIPQPAAGSRPAGRTSPRLDRLAEVDEAALRPIPHRPGRGGYDPEAAEAARAYRYSRRRRVAVTLLLATLLCTAVAVLVTPLAWIGTGVFGLLLIGYLAYLRRQVHIEADIRERRLARLRRARQIRPEYDLDLHRTPAPPTGSDFVRSAVPAAQVPSTGYRRGREIVDLEDDDPSFDELEYYQPLSYRRASGQ